MLIRISHVFNIVLILSVLYFALVDSEVVKVSGAWKKTFGYLFLVNFFLGAFVIGVGLFVLYKREYLLGSYFIVTSILYFFLTNIIIQDSF